MFEKFTDSARKVYSLANLIAQDLNQEFILPEHHLYGLVREEKGRAARIFAKQGLDLKEVIMELQKRVKKGHEIVIMGRLPQAIHSKKVIEEAIEYSRKLNGNIYVGTEHLGYALFSIYGGTAREILQSCNITKDNYESELKMILEQEETI